jgi:Dynamin family
MPEGIRLLEADFARLRDALSRRFASSGDWRVFRSMRALTSLEADLARPLRVAVMGEQSSGKSSLINVLMRANVVPAGALAGIRAYLLLRHGPEAALSAVGLDGSRARLTSKALARMSGPEMQPVPSSMTIYSASEPTHVRREELADAGLLGPGLRAPAEGITRLIEIIQPRDFLRRAELVEGRGWPETSSKSVLRHTLPVDLAVWCTLGTQAWKETERQSWDRLPAKLRGNAVLLVTYKDALGAAKQEAKLMSRLERHAGPLFANIILVSLRQAAEALGPNGVILDEGKWRRSGAADFEAALQSQLSMLQHVRRLRSVRLLGRLAAQTTPGGAPSAIVSPLVTETGRHIQGLIRHIEERRAPGEADLSAEVTALAREDKPPAVYGQETR